MLSVEKFVEKQLMLLDLEEKAELKENEETYGTYSLNELKLKKLEYVILLISKIESGLCNRKLVTLQRRDKDDECLSRNMKPGDIGLVGQISDGSNWNFKAVGVLSAVKSDSLTIALDDASGLEENTTCYFFKINNFRTYKQMRSTLAALKKRSLANEMISVLFAESPPSSFDGSTLKFEFINKNLNDDQKEAVEFALCQKEIAVLHGPPGTGKTTTVVEVILQLVKQGLKVLACAPSNVAVDNIVEGLAHYTTKIVRLGHPARVLPNCQRYNLDYIIEQNEGKKIIRDVEKDIAALNNVMAGFSSGARNVHSKTFRSQRRQLQQEIQHRRGEIIKDIVKNCEVVASTLMSAHPHGILSNIPAEFFDVVIIDECSQALEVECWIPLLYVKRCVLAGDHLQLPPVIYSSEAAEKGLSETLMERVLHVYGDKVKKLLTIQYRMHKDIMRWSSEKLYDNQLKPHASVASHLLCELSGVEENKDTSIPLLLIDTAGTYMYDHELIRDDSKGNDGEAQLVAVHVEALISSGVDARDIAVVTPYNLQVDLIKQLLSEKYPELEIRSVDGFQGREKEAVVLSLVRSNEKGEVGFLQEHRRLNVAITRARRHLAVICDSTTVSNNDFLKHFIDYMHEVAEVRAAFEYIPDLPPIIRHACGSPEQPAKEKHGTGSKKKAKEKSSSDGKATPDVSSEKRPANNPFVCDQRREKYEAMIEKFVQSGERTLEFPPGLSSYDRMLIHEAAEKLNLLHKSEGEGQERIITLTKKEHAASKQENSFASLPIDDCESASDGNTKPSHSEQAHSIVDSKTSSKQSNSNSVLKPPRPKKKNVSTKHQANLNLNNCQSTGSPYSKVLDSTSGFDDLLEAVTELDNTCQFQSCGNKLKYLLQTCRYCNLRFCLSHHQPEVHGCGAAAKAYARSMIRKEGVLYPGSGRPKKPSNPVLKADLEKKMQKKLTELSDKRKSKPPKK